MVLKGTVLLLNDELRLCSIRIDCWYHCVCCLSFHCTWEENSILM